MLRVFLITLVGFFSLHLLTAQRLNVQEAKEDINQLKNSFERYHAGLNRFTSEDSINYYFKLVDARLTEDITLVDFYKEVTFLLNKVRCGHTRTSMPQRVNDQFRQAHLFMPISVRYLGEELVIDEFLTNEGNLKKGEVILTINDMPVRDITKRIFDHHSADGFINSSKYRRTEMFFRYYYQLFVSPKSERYILRIKGLDGQLRTVSITGERAADLQALDPEPRERGVLNLEHRNGYSYMKIGTFGSGTLNRAGLDYEGFLAESFRELKNRGVKNLVLDLRGNGGGDDNYGALLVSYFASEPFRYFERIEVTDAYSGYGNVSRRGNRNLMTSHRGLSVWQPKADRFEGKVYVLTDGWSFSTCADVATVLHHHGWATFIGEETGGGYDGNTSGNSRTLTLDNSGFRINLPMWMYTTANLGHDYYGRGVIPDYPVIPTINEFREGGDVVLKKAESLIRN